MNKERLEVIDVDTETKDTSSFFGWRWPDSAIVTGAELWFRRDERIINRRLEKRRPGQRAVNFSFPAGRHMANVEVWIRLYSEISGEKIAMQPRLVHSIQNTNSKASE